MVYEARCAISASMTSLGTDTKEAIPSAELGRAWYLNLVTPQIYELPNLTISKSRQKMAFDQGSIAFIGLGVMGYPMATNLRKKIGSNRILIVYDINQAATNRFQLQTKGFGPVKIVGTAYEALQEADVVFTMLPSDSAVKSVYLDPESGLFAAAEAARTTGTRKLLVECGTVAQATISEVSQRSKDYNVTFIDAPVSGGPMGSEAGTLSFMVGCSEALFPSVKGLLSPMGTEDSIFRCGEVGSGTAFKIINNYISIISILSVSEALNIADKMDLDMRLLVDLINISSGQCWVSSNNNPVPGIHPNAPASHNYEGGFRIELAEKVLRLGSELAESVGAPTYLDKTALEVYGAAKSRYAGKDARVVYKWLSELSKSNP
ncbi:hypothetical protein AC579_910 [Pseudocercospora musae]|uniref:3-hydroxyisobutyrate dehydrogenase n=1 Tax=Pseudocercospora musae TaxID=113226 RepID=A0A139INN4_9PEZI|nr:hypothetical protein AC579_910 [Pseudocercospora musae]